jgi:hypothetical protein
LTISYVKFDGADTDNKAIYPENGQIRGALSITNCEFTGIANAIIIDTMKSATLISSAPGSLSSVVFTSNTVKTGNKGHIAFRGRLATSLAAGYYLDTVTITKNELSTYAANTEISAGMIITDAKTVVFKQNKIDKVVTCVNPASDCTSHDSFKARGWGAGLFMWSTQTWTFEAKYNDITNNAGGILIAQTLQGFSTALKIPDSTTDSSKTTSYTNFEGNSKYGMAIVKIDKGATLNFMDDTTFALEEVDSTNTENNYNAPHNYWGHFRGAKGQGTLMGRGVTVSKKLTVTTFLSCWDDHSTSKFWCTDGSGTDPGTDQPSRCMGLASLKKAGKCVADASSCTGSGTEKADYHDTRTCVGTCPTGQVPATAYGVTNVIYGLTQSTTNVCYAKEVMTATSANAL